MATAGLYGAGVEEKVDRTIVSHQPLHAADIPFEEFLYHAAVQRRAEAHGLGIADAAKGSHTQSHSSDSEAITAADKHWFNGLSEKKGPNVNLEQRLPEALPVDDYSGLSADEMERINASRALRRATWASVFYLITTVSIHLHRFRFADCYISRCHYTDMHKFGSGYFGLVFWISHCMET